MSDVVIRVEGLGKKYVIGHKKGRGSSTLRDVIVREAQAFVRKAGDVIHGRPVIAGDELEDVWALRDVNFEVKRGELLGVIGRNGAGKSTLLKILSRITEPTEGRVEVRGRIASLLEVGTGFHPELSGRENIYLNGAILGMARSEIRRKFDEIVAFAEVEKFLDTPVKRYSSGMYVRLAFAVAAHLEPEIMIIDEVLAVGDAQFQKKCLGKMDEFSKREGRTVIFVSHNMAAVSNLCQRGISLKGGRLLFEGTASEAIVQYYKDSKEPEGNDDGILRGRDYESETARLLGAELVGVPNPLEITIHDQFAIRVRYRIKRSVDGKCVPNFHFFSSAGSCVFVTQPDRADVIGPGEYCAECTIPGGLLNEGAYFVGVALTTYYDSRYDVEFNDKNAVTFNVIDPMDARSNRYSYIGPMPGVVRPKLAWQVSSGKP
jgi:lipopolysaccharide transport system ATP-binding protein